MRTPPISHALRLAGAVGLLAVTTAAFYTGRRSLDAPVIALLYLLPVGLCTAFWGLGTGITAAFIAFLAFNFVFIEPYYTMAVHRPGDVVMLLVFLIVAVVISQLLGRAQRGLAAARAREREATQLYELSTALAGLHDPQAIARVLAEKVQVLVGAAQVELSVSGDPPQTVYIPAAPSQRPDRPSLTLPIRAAREPMGEIRLWRDSAGASLEERRLLHTFASQGALALERAGLAQAEARARVLEESDRLKSAILSSVSHELRTPLSTIKAAATSLRSGEVEWKSGTRADLLAAIDEETDHLNVLVGNLLDMSRLESGALKPDREWNLLSEIVGSVLGRMRRLTEGHHIQLDLPEDLPLIPVDFVQMEQVFTNLLSNSLKYAPLGTEIRIQASLADESAVRVQVSNQGPPVREGDLERIFDKFYRITDADRVTGIGLGLSICKGIVEAHGGRIWAENLPSGFAFRFTLPLGWEGAAAAQPPPEPEAG